MDLGPTFCGPPARKLCAEFHHVFLKFVRRQSFSECFGFIVTEALVRFLFQFKRQRIGAASVVFGMVCFLISPLIFRIFAPRP